MNGVYVACILILLFILMFIAGYFIGHYVGRRTSSFEQAKLDEMQKLIKDIKKDLANREITFVHKKTTTFSENNPF